MNTFHSIRVTIEFVPGEQAGILLFEPMPSSEANAQNCRLEYKGGTANFYRNTLPAAVETTLKLMSGLDILV